MAAETTPVMPRIVRAMSFPVGYEFLREHFGAATEAPETRIRFRAHPTTFASEFTQVLCTGEPYPILRVRRCSQLHPRGSSPAHWDFTVSPVASPLRSVARSALVTGALSQIKDFVARAPTHWNYHNCCSALFDPVNGTCQMEQLHPL